MSLSTLAYAYPSTSLLLRDMVIEYRESIWDAIINQVGGGGLRLELQAAARRYFIHVLGDRARTALIRWEMHQLANGDLSASEADLAVTEVLIDRIAEKADEHYRVPHGVLAQMVLTFTYGQSVQWIPTGDDSAYWSTLMAGIDGAVVLADARPRETPHDLPAPADCATMTPPLRDA